MTPARSDVQRRRGALAEAEQAQRDERAFAASSTYSTGAALRSYDQVARVGSEARTYHRQRRGRPDRDRASGPARCSALNFLLAPRADSQQVALPVLRRVERRGRSDVVLRHWIRASD